MSTDAIAVAHGTAAAASMPHRRHVDVAEASVALAITFLLGVQYRISPDINIGYFAAAAVLPVTIRLVRLYRGAGLLLVLAGLAAASGLALTFLSHVDDLADHSRAIVQTARVLGLALGAMAVLWARATAGVRVTVLVYALGCLAGTALTGLNPDNVWKFSLEVPVTMLVLTLPLVFRRPAVEVVALMAISVLSALNDARSAAAMVVLAAAIIVTQQVRGRTLRRSTRVGAVLLRLGCLGIAAFYLAQSLILDGALGEAARERTVRQIDTSGSVLLGGRPEIGASIALISERPAGYGSGTLASPGDVLVAKSGMAALGYDPDNGYVERYMFGLGFEVHSVIGDLWLLYGVAGLLLGVLSLVLVLGTTARQVGTASASAVMLYLSIRTVWDFAFAPWPSAMYYLVLVVALAMPLRSRAEATGPVPAAPVAQRATPPAAQSRTAEKP